MEKLIIYWARRDFRLLDNPALTFAIAKSKLENTPLLPIFILDDAILQDTSKNIGYCRKKYLSLILSDFSKNFPNFHIFLGGTGDIFQELSKSYQIELFFNDDIEPYAITRDNQISELIKKSGGNSTKCSDIMTVSLDTVSGSGTRYSVFSPFRNSVIDSFVNTPAIDAPDFTNILWKKDLGNSSLDKSLQSQLISCQFDPQINLADKIFALIDTPNILTLNQYWQINIDEIIPRQDISYWYKNEQEARQVFENFNVDKLLNYKFGRDSLSSDTENGGQTSKMSLALKWGFVSPRTLCDKIIKKHGISSIYSNQNIFHFISELIWREFYKYLLFHNPSLLDTEFQPKFRGTIKWETGNREKELLNAWITGQTGYPVVDAAMSQLNNTYWMHNRARMVVGSILTKNFGIDWRHGQNYFRLMLLDCDEASNNGGWQWSASVGADPKPIRIFNPDLQSKNYDQNRLYQKYWLDKSFFQSPFTPLVPHSFARDNALKRYNLSKSINDRNY